MRRPLNADARAFRPRASPPNPARDLALDFSDLLFRWRLEATAEALANPPGGFFQDPFFVENHDAIVPLVIRKYVSSRAAGEQRMGPTGKDGEDVTALLLSKSSSLCRPLLN